MDEQEQAFLAAIRNNPRDEASRMAYADYRAEHGDCLGQKQYELKKLSHEIEELKRNHPITKLLEKHHVSGILHRGFCDDLKGTAANILALLNDPEMPWVPLSHIEITVPNAPELLRHPALAKLESLQIFLQRHQSQSDPLPASDEQVIATLEHLTNSVFSDSLQKLYIKYYPFHVYATGEVRANYQNAVDRLASGPMPKLIEFSEYNDRDTDDYILSDAIKSAQQQALNQRTSMPFPNLRCKTMSGERYFSDAQQRGHELGLTAPERYLPSTTAQVNTSSPTTTTTPSVMQ